ncbi:hypothetical protein [Streptomyces sp. NBC_01012]|uniref:hypothetical protein n=1 Tax=Streptomyces sp. NBC_01012 TaxID=2903717 RepID=UPI00386DA7A5
MEDRPPPLRRLPPLPAHGLYDGVARALFALWQAYALTHGGPRLLWLFLVVEVAFGLVQLVPWVGRRSGGTVGQPSVGWARQRTIRTRTEEQT